MKKLDHVSILVRNLDEATKLYTGMFDCRNPKTYEIEKFYDEMKEKGMVLLYEDGKHLIDKKYVTPPSGNKYAYLPREKTFGTSTEVLERIRR